MHRHSFPALPHLVFAAMMLHCGLAQAKVAQVYLVQNSGWMEPFFTDPKSELRPLLHALVTDTRMTGAEVLIASFNQQGAIPGEDSPRLLYHGTADDLSTVTKVIAALNLPQKPNGRFADADFEGALRNTLDTLLQRRPGVIWMITNNKNDPNNSPDVQLHTQASPGLWPTQ